VIAVSGLVIGLVLVLGLFIFAIPSLTESGKVEVQLGPDRFDAGPVDDRAETIAASGPILLPDVAGNERDVFVQHVGDDARAGWFVFDARREGVGRECTVEWHAESRVFVDPCDGTTIDERGEGLRQYDVEVTDDDQLVVDLRGDR
jgi:hypothetical protein